MKDEKKLIKIGKILLGIQVIWSIVGIAQVVGVAKISKEISFLLLTMNMILAVIVGICMDFYQKKVEKEKTEAELDFLQELNKAKKRELELKKRVEKETQSVKKLQRASRKKQRGKNKNCLDLEKKSGSFLQEEREVYPYKAAREHGAKFITGNMEKRTASNKVLIVDDSMTNLKLLAAFLKKMNIEACVAKSGKEAIESVQREDFALILIDHMMKGKNGLETVKEIRQLKGAYYQNVPIVDVLSMGMEQYEVVLNQEYYQAYLTKPIDYEMLQQVMIAYGVYEERMA